MVNIFRILLLFVVFVVLPPITYSGAGTVYKWVDDSGNVHYGQQPMSDSAEKITIHSAAPATPPEKTSEDSAKKQEAGSNKTKAFLERRAEMDKKYQEELKVYCDTLKQRLETIQRGGRIYVADKSGERTYLDDNMRQAELTKAQENIASKCN